MKNKVCARVIVPLLIGVLLIIALSGADFLAENPFYMQREFQRPSCAITAPDGRLIVIEDGKSRVTVLTQGRISAGISGKNADNGFFYAEHAASDGEYIYIADVKYFENTTSVECERIMRFSTRGRYMGTLYERKYSLDMPLQYGNIMDMRVVDGRLMFLLNNAGALELYSLKGGNAALTLSVDAQSAPYLCTAVYDAGRQNIYAVSKTGLIYAKDDNDSLTAISDPGGAGQVPWGIAADRDGRFLYTNLTGPGIMRFDNSVYLAADDIVYRLHTNDEGVLSFADSTGVYQLSPDGETLFAGTNVTYSAGYIARRLVVWLSALTAGAALIYAAIRALLWVLRGNSGGRTKYFIVIIIAMVLTCIIVSVNTLGGNLEYSAKRNAYSLTQMTLSVSGLSGRVFGDEFEAIQSLDDYGGEAFNRIHEALDPICTSAHAQGEHLYFVLYKVIDGMLTVVMDYENTTGVIYPLEPCPEPYAKLMSGELPYLYEREDDSYGSWIYAVAPVFNTRGAIVGLVEMGSNLDVETLRMQRQIRDVVLSTAVLLVLVLIVYTQAIALWEALYEKKRIPKASHIPGLIRPLTFLAFLTDNMSAAFIPQLSGSIFLQSGFDMSPSMGAALPLSAHLLCIALAALIGGALMVRFGMRRVLVMGIVVELSGLALTAAAIDAQSYAMLLAGMGVSGCGLGVVVVSGNTLPASFVDEDMRNALFSGVNAGLVSGVVVGASLGSYLAQATGYANTFYISAAILIPAIWLGHKSAPAALPPTAHAPEESALGSLAFLGSRGVYAFLLFMMFPFLAMLYFKDFVFPLFAADMGLSEVGIGQVLLFSGAASILTAPAAARWLLKRLGPKRTNMLTGASLFCALLLFSLLPVLSVSIAAVCVLSIAGAVGLTAQSVYFSSLRAFRAYGASKAMGVFSLMDNISQTAGPLLFGAALILGYRYASLLVGLVAAALFVLFAFICHDA